jgi:hypothetical protein
MSAINEVITALQSVVDKLDDASGATNTASTEANEAVGQAVALGAAGAVAGLTIVKDSVEGLAQQIAATLDHANQALTTARGVADGT